MTFLLPGGLGQLGAHGLSSWDPTTTGWSAATPPGLRAEIPAVEVTGPIFSNGNRTIIDGDGSHGEPLGVRGAKPIPTTGTAANLRRYFEVQAGNSGEVYSGLEFTSVGLVLPAWNAVTVAIMPLGEEVAGTSLGLWVLGTAYFAFFANNGTGTFISGAGAGDTVGIAVDNSGVDKPGHTAVWFSVNGVYSDGSTMFPGLATPDFLFPTLTQVWPACSTDYVYHMTINPSSTPLHLPPGFTFHG